MATTDFATSLDYPGVIAIHAPARDLRDGETVVPKTAHPTHLDMYEDFEPPLQPLIPADTGTSEGTAYQFVTSTRSVHKARAWHLSGFTDWALDLEVRFPTNANLRFSNAAGPHTPWYEVSLSGSASAPAKAMKDSCIIVVPPESPVARAGLPGGYLDTNCGMTGVLGTWDLGGLTEDFYTVSDAALSGVTVNNWSADGATLLGALDVYLKVELKAYGNTSLLRYRSGEAHDGAWQYPSLFWAEIRLTLYCPDFTEGIFEAPDGTHDSDDSVNALGATDGYVSSLLGGAIAVVDGIECGYTEVESLSPDVTMYYADPAGSGVGSPYRVPWIANDGGPDVVTAATEVRNVTLAITGRVNSTLPDAL